MHLLIIHSSSDLYGSDKSLLDFVTHCHLHKITVVLPNQGTLVDLLRVAGAEVLVGEVCKIQRGMLSPFGLTKLMGTAYKALTFLGDLHKQQQFDLVYSNTVAVLGGALAAKAWGVPHVWHVREIMSKSRSLSWCFRQLVSALSTRVVCNSGETLAWIKLPNAVPKYSMIWNGFDSVEKAFDRNASRAALGVVGDEVLFVLVGRINWWKGQKLLFVRLPLWMRPLANAAGWPLWGRRLRGKHTLRLNWHSALPCLGLLSVLLYSPITDCP